MSNLSNVVENTSAAQSRIQDADFALGRLAGLESCSGRNCEWPAAAPQNVLSLLG